MNPILNLIFTLSLGPAIAAGSPLVRAKAAFTLWCLRNLPERSQAKYVEHCADPTTPNRVAANEEMEREGFVRLRQLLPMVRRERPELFS